MTTAFAPPLAIFAGPSMPTDIQQPQYTSQASFTPPSSSESPSNQSPISPRTSFNLPAHLRMHSQQIKQPKSPLYVPAVLRPTEKPIRHSPPKKNGFGSIDSGVDMEASARSQDAVRPGMMNRNETEEYNEAEMGVVKGAPSRNHWKLDTESPTCDDPSCSKHFTIFQRRHHCRRCGLIFCNEHSSHVVPLNEKAKFHPQGPKFRACNGCFSDYRNWEVERISRTNSTNSRDSTTPTPTTPNIPFFNRFKPGGDSAKNASLAQSVPRDWNWSTF